MKKTILAVVSLSLISPLLPGSVHAGLSAPLKSAGGGRAMFTGDLNNDGYDDLIVFPDDRVKLEVALSRGNGTLRKRETLKGPKGKLCERLSTERPTTGLHDVNDDGRLDVVAYSYVLHGKIQYNGGGAAYGDYTWNQTIWLGNGDGTFGAANTTSLEIKGFVIPAGISPQGYSLADLDGDGEVDLAYFSVQKDAGRFKGPIAVSFDFEHTPSDPVYLDIGGGQFLSIVAGDFNGDGWVDIVVAGATRAGEPNDELTVFLNDQAW